MAGNSENNNSRSIYDQELAIISNISNITTQANILLGHMPIILQNASRDVAQPGPPYAVPVDLRVSQPTLLRPVPTLPQQLPSDIRCTTLIPPPLVPIQNRPPASNASYSRNPVFQNPLPPYIVIGNAPDVQTGQWSFIEQMEQQRQELSRRHIAVINHHVAILKQHGLINKLLNDFYVLQEYRFRNLDFLINQELIRLNTRHFARTALILPSGESNILHSTMGAGRREDQDVRNISKPHPEPVAPVQPAQPAVQNMDALPSLPTSSSNSARANISNVPPQAEYQSSPASPDQTNRNAPQNNFVLIQHCLYDSHRRTLPTPSTTSNSGTGAIPKQGRSRPSATVTSNSTASVAPIARPTNVPNNPELYWPNNQQQLAELHNRRCGNNCSCCPRTKPS